MKLLFFLIVSLLISISVEVSRTGSSKLQSVNARSQDVQQSCLRMFASRFHNWIVGSFPILKFQSRVRVKNPFDYMPDEALDKLALYLSSDFDIKNLALTSESFRTSPFVTVIQNIRKHCYVKGNRIFPILTLAVPPTSQCAKSIVASNRYFQIKRLQMEYVKMTLDGAQHIISIVQINKLIHLSLFQCSLTHEMLLIILNDLPRSKLTLLDLRGSQINSTGAKAIAQTMQKSILKKLVLQSGKIGEEGAIAIAAALPHSELTKLDLTWCRIGDGGAEAIAAAMPQSKLVYLDLQSNHISDRSLSYLMRQKALMEREDFVLKV